MTPVVVPGTPEWTREAERWRRLKLGARQEVALELLCTRLVPFILSTGHCIRGGEFWRPPEMVAIYAARGSGSGSSVHPLKLAWDLNVMSPDGRLLEKTEEHRPFGEFWERVHPGCRWGGRFKGRPDGNHYSMEFEGRA